MEKTVNIAQMIDVMTDRNTYCQVAENLLNSWQKSCKKIVIINNAQLSSLRHMYGLPKIH